MCSEVVEPEDLYKEFEAVAAQLKEALEDLEWRKPDVEDEEAQLKDLKRKAKKDPTVDVASQAIVVRVGREILDDKIKEARRLDARLKEIQAALEEAEKEQPAPEEKVEGGEAVPEEAE